MVNYFFYGRSPFVHSVELELSSSQDEEMVSEKEEAFECYLDLPLDLQKYVISHISNVKTVQAMLCTCTQLYNNLTLWPESHNYQIMYRRYSYNSCFSPTLGEDFNRLVERVGRALQNKQIAISSPLTVVGMHIGKFATTAHPTIEIPVTAIHFMGQKELPDLNTLSYFPFLRELEFSNNCANLKEFTLSQMPSVTSLRICSTDLTTESCLALLNCFPNLTKFSCRRNKHIDFRKVVQTIKPRPLIEEVEFPIDQLQGADFLQVLHTFPNQQLKTINLCNCLEINNIDLSKMRSFPETKTLDVSGSPITVNTLFRILKKIPNVETLCCYGCPNLSIEEFRGRESVPSVKNFGDITYSEEDINVLKWVFPEAQFATGFRGIPM